MNPRKKHLIIGSTAAAVGAALLLVGCVAVAPSAISAFSKPAGIVNAAPTPETTSTVPPSPKAGFVDTSPGAPKVKRAGEKAAGDRIGAPTSTFSTPAGYANGISLAPSKFSRGTITSRGTGIITGAPFIVFQLTLQNGSQATVDVSQVVVTLKYGAKDIAAAPLYDDVTAQDFAGSIAAGQSQTATYAFQIPKNVTSANLYVDVNGNLLPAHFDGTLPNG